MTDRLELMPATKERTLKTVRIVHATKEQVFKAWTTPSHLSKWWGPKGFTSTIQTHELKPGGRWSFVMHSPDGQAYPNECIYVKIDSPGGLIWNHVSGHFFQVVATFEEVAVEKTRVTFQMIFETPEECARVTEFAKDKNEENMDKLEAVLRDVI
jgi:uncharacterized protein YndB with AHSA1/START domain